MAWEVLGTDEFEEWYGELTVAQQEAVNERVALLEQRGPHLKRPLVGEIQSSRHHNMKELICNQGGSLRLLFIFDPHRSAIILLGGDKTGQWDEWYRTNVPLADDLYDAYLKREGLK